MSDDRVTERMDNIRDHSLQHLTQLEEGRGDAGADLQPLAGDLTDILADIAPAIDGVVQQFLYWIILSAAQHPHPQNIHW